MTPERWNRIQSLFAAVVDLPPVDRVARLREACDGDLRLCGEVETLLEADRLAGESGFIRRMIDAALRDGA